MPKEVTTTQSVPVYFPQKKKKRRGTKGEKKMTEALIALALVEEHGVDHRDALEAVLEADPEKAAAKLTKHIKDPEKRAAATEKMAKSMKKKKEGKIPPQFLAKGKKKKDDDGDDGDSGDKDKKKEGKKK